jgi:opacity protein-like surface antigen
LLDQGRSISRLAYVPRTLTPYVGAGAGMLYYQFSQTGDFVDFVTLRVFPDTFRSKGWAPSAHVFAGTDVRIWRALFVDVEGRYVWAQGTLGSDFVGFDGIDLVGFRLSTGMRIAF